MSWFTFRHEAMATHFEIVITGKPEAYARPAALAAFREIDRLELELSRFVPGSDISRANALTHGGLCVLGADTFDCLVTAADVSLATGRAFDVAYGSTPMPGAPSDELPFVLDAAAFAVTSRASVLRLDLGAVGKGYALDRAAEILREWSITDACLVAGGSTVLAMAPPINTGGWRIGIGDEPAVRAIEIANASLSASGTAVKGAHLIDPRTGRSAARTSRAWALAETAAQSDALSTAFFVLSDAEVRAFCVAHPEVGAALSGAGEGLVCHGALAKYDLEESR